MIFQHLDNPKVSELVSNLIDALLQQEQFYLCHYDGKSTHPQFMNYTKQVNTASAELSSCLTSLNIPASFSHKITLVDDSMDTELLQFQIEQAYHECIAFEKKSDSQVVVYVSQEKASEVEASLFRLNNEVGIINCIDLVDRTNRPYILGLNSWKDAHNMKRDMAISRQYVA